MFYEAEAKLLRGPLGHLDFGLATGKVDDPASAQQCLAPRRINFMFRSHAKWVMYIDIPMYSVA